MPRETLPEETNGSLPGSLGDASARTWTALAGAFLVALGGYLPWLRYNPDYEGIGLVLSPQVKPGFEGFDAVLLAPSVSSSPSSPFAARRSGGPV
jgi:hypothetical protein